MIMGLIDFNDINPFPDPIIPPDDWEYEDDDGI